MENQLIQLYLFVCQIYDTRSQTCFQRESNNSKPKFTDQELVCIWFFGHLEGNFNKRQIYHLIENYWADWFPNLPSYQTFCYRLNLLELTFQTIGAELFELLHAAQPREIDHLIDSFPVMLSQNGHSYTAQVARQIADVGYCAAKKTYFHRRKACNVIASRRFAQLPNPSQIWLCEASHHDLTAAKEQYLQLPNTSLIADLAYPEAEFAQSLKKQSTCLLTGYKKPKGKDLTKFEKYHNRLISKFRQPIESLFNWINEKTNIQTASKVRSTDGLLLHCWGKLAVAFFLLVFNY
ncbi:MAG: transposase [Acidobacteria bacterium]|nr:transposase [Acidobacteriota bacterium]